MSGILTIPYIDQIENLLYDTRVRLSAPGGIDERIVIVAIDEASLQEHRPLAVHPRKVGQMMDNLFAYGAPWSALTCLFAERDESADMDLLRRTGHRRKGPGFPRKRWMNWSRLIDRDRLFAEAMQRPDDPGLLLRPVMKRRL